MLLLLWILLLYSRPCYILISYYSILSIPTFPSTHSEYLLWGSWPLLSSCTGWGFNGTGLTLIPVTLSLFDTFIAGKAVTWSFHIKIWYNTMFFLFNYMLLFGLSLQMLLVHFNWICKCSQVPSSLPPTGVWSYPWCIDIAILTLTKSFGDMWWSVPTSWLMEWFLILLQKQSSAWYPCLCVPLKLLWLSW